MKLNHINLYALQAVAHLATVLPDGSPHSVPIWVGTHGDHLVFLTGPESRKARNLRQRLRSYRVAAAMGRVAGLGAPVASAMIWMARSIMSRETSR